MAGFFSFLVLMLLLLFIVIFVCVTISIVSIGADILEAIKEKFKNNVS